MTSKVEEVARAIASANGDDGMFKAFLPHARAAIKVMRTPTEWMLTKGCCYENDVPSILMGDGIVAGNVWQAMIDAALSEEGR